MSTDSFARFALEPPTGRITVESVAGVAGWVCAQTVPADLVFGMEIIWTRSNQDELHYVEDGTTGQPYLIVRGASTAALTEEIRAAFRCLDLSEVLAKLRTAKPSDHARLASMLSVLAIDGDHGVIVHAIADLLASPDPSAQRDALATVANLGWPELMPLAVALANASENTAVRERAEDVLAAYRAQAASLGTPAIFAGDAWRPEQVLPTFREVEMRRRFG